MMRQRGNKPEVEPIFSSDPLASDGDGDGDDDDDKARGRITKRIFPAAWVAVASTAAVGLLGYGAMRETMRNGAHFRGSHRMQETGYIQPHRRFTPAPKEYRKTYWVQQKPMQHVIVRALDEIGWTPAKRLENAHIIFTKGLERVVFPVLKPWQRYNHHPMSFIWNNKDTFYAEMLKYRIGSGREVPSLPESYRLDDNVEYEIFQRRLFKEGGLDIPWVLKKTQLNNGQGITVLGPQSDDLRDVLRTVKEDREHKHVIQKYVCNEMTYNGFKFDFRTYWMIISMDPLIVMYHDAFVRLGNNIYDESDFSNTVDHLTTGAGTSMWHKGSWASFEELIKKHARKHSPFLWNPVEHVKKQARQASGEMAAAFKDLVFQVGNKNFPSENNFGWFAADFYH